MKPEENTQEEHQIQGVNNKLRKKSSKRKESQMKTEEKLWDDSDKWRIWFLDDPQRS